jgi:hypothetical protein
MRSACFAPRSRASRGLVRGSFRALSAALVAALALGATGCIDHLNNARVRGADEFECKRADMTVTEVDDHVFVVRGCEQEGAFRCETGIEGGCKRVQGKAAERALALAPEPEEEKPAKKKKKKKKADDSDDATDASAKDEAAEKAKKDEAAAKAKKEEAAKAEEAEAAEDAEKKKKKKKKKSEDE